MRTFRKAVTVSVVGALAIGVFAAAGPAGADPVPTSADVVGVGSDVVQYAVDFVADGDPFGDAGYNSAGNVNRLIDFDATGDANGRAGYLNGSTLAATKPQNPTIVLREGESPVQRPNGGGAGIKALIADGSAGVSVGNINFARSPNEPTAAQQTTAQSNLGSQLDVVQIASDSQVIATATTTNAPSGLSAAELVDIYNGTYTKWNQLPGNSGGSSDTIIPLIPPTTAGVYTTFVNALKAANGGTAVTLSGAVQTVEQNDPTAITTLTTAQQPDAIVPFPTSRLNLWNENYFLNPATPYGVGSSAPSTIAAGVKLLTATAPDGSASFTTPLPYYIIFRASDLASTTPWQPGSTLNWVKALFANPGSSVKPYFDTAAGQALIADSGATPDYDFLGVVSSG
jgi:ABC-type phosphate transport system substrate-binding protein